MVEAWRLVNSLELIISSFRRGGLCRVKLDSVERYNSEFKVKRTYTLTEYVLFSGEKIIEKEVFEAILDKDYKVLSMKITPQRLVQRRRSRF
ncbi:MAG: hypothetical protein DRJ38_07950 [Thermoprotei archaeon]|nr:MAG: hypothetical protein DRJ38_07950 [Thermoprotei archaeon]